MKIDNSFNKSDYNKRKKYREEADRGQEMKRQFKEIRLKKLKRRKRNILSILIRDNGKNGCR